jgi:Uma2 family endonuclease
MEAARKIPETMTTAEFLAWDAPGKLWQLIDGTPEAMAPPSPAHGAIQSEIARLVGNHLVESAAACRIITTPGIVPRARSRQNFRIPDLGVTCSPVEQEGMLRDPVLLIEILSPTNEAETWSNVWTYTTIPSVREILVIRSDEIGAELVRRQADGTWPEQALTLREGELRLESIGFSCELADLYRGIDLKRRSS